MPRLTWDKDSEKFYETGTRDVVLYKKEGNAYPKGEAWNGVTAVTESPSGAESNPLYADDIKYLDLRSAEEFGGTIEAYTYPDGFVECDGSAEIVPGLKVGQQTRKSFGLVYTTVKGDGVDFNDAGDLIHLIYNATASPSERSYQTINDSPEAITFSWEFSTTPIEVTQTITTQSGTSTKKYKKSAILTVDTKKILATENGATRLNLLKDVLYGTDGTGSGTGTEPMLPLPSQVIGILDGTITTIQAITG